MFRVIPNPVACAMVLWIHRSARHAQIVDQESFIDVLINNAGAVFSRRRLTEDGIEYTFALNHIAYFVVTEGLRERLLAAKTARIINTASAAHQGASLDFDDLQSEKSFGAIKAYGRSKLCNILFTRELARRLRGTGVTANCLRPWLSISTDGPTVFSKAFAAHQMG